MGLVTLSKWYLDLVADDGEAFIAYAAEVQLGALAVSYAELLHHRAGSTRSRSSLRRATPILNDGTVAWSSPELGARGAWRAACGGIREVLLEDERGRVEWACHAPLARGEIALDDGRVVRGLGYVEELTLTIAPWDLPLDELRWGRFTAEGESVVWVDWRGPHVRRVILRNGARVDGTVNDDAVDMPESGARLTLEPGAILRRGRLGTHALRSVAHLHALFPTRFLAVFERKELSRATLAQRGAPPSRGWTIHEVVRWT